MSRLNISFLGTFQVRLDRQPIPQFHSSNNQGFLVYLALQSQKTISRELLTAVTLVRSVLTVVEIEPKS